MKQIPILFKTEMVQAILAGRKTQTRRLITPQPNGGVRESPFVKSGIEDIHGREIKSKWAIGDQLWVRETFGWNPDYPEGIMPCYKADPGHEYDGIKWKPSLFMPREASRITLEITNVRVERLLSISEEDAIAEGIEKVSALGAPMTLWRNYSPKDVETFGRFDTVFAAQESYFSLWDSINGKQSHLLNPWLWVIEFKHI